MIIGYTFSISGDYPSTRITIILEKNSEVAKGDLIYVEHPKSGLPVVYQVIRVYSHKETRDYEEALLKEGRVIKDEERTTVRAEAYQWGWNDRGAIRPLRYPLSPHTPVFKAPPKIIQEFTKPSSSWKVLLGVDASSGLNVELDLYYLIRQCCLICGAVGTGKTTSAISLIARAAQVEPPVKFLIVDKDGEYCSLKEIFGENVKRVPWPSFFRSEELYSKDILGEFGWQKSWWTSKILLKALGLLKLSKQPLHKRALIEAVKSVSDKSVGFSKSEEDLDSYKKQVFEAVRFSKIIPHKASEGLDPVDLLTHHKIVILDLSVGSNGWAKKHIVLTQVLRRVFHEALENSTFGCVVVLEEAMYYAPQWTQFSIGDKSSRDKLLSIVKEIATNGGRNGIGLWIVTQRLATVDKCVSGDTPLLLSDGTLLPIRVLFQKMLKLNKTVIKNDSEVVIRCDAVEVGSFNSVTGKIVFAKPLNVYRRKLQGNLLEVTTLSGRRVNVTEEHPFYTLLNGKIAPIKAKNLQKDGYIAVPRVIKTKLGSELRPLQNVTPELARLIAFMLSECSRIEKNLLHFSSHSRELKKQVTKIIEDLYQVVPTEFNRGKREDIFVDLSSLGCFTEPESCDVLTATGMHESETKKISNVILGASDAVIAHFLQAFFDCDGKVMKEPKIMIKSSSKDIIYQLSYLLLRFGIFSQVHTTEYSRKNDNRLYIVHKRNLETFLKHIGFTVRDKQEKLKQHIEQIDYPKNYDVLPKIEPPAAKAFNKNRKSSKLDDWVNGLRNISRRELQIILGETKNDNTVLNVLAYSDIYWDKVKSIKILNSEEYVYDLEIAQTHSFIGGHGPLILHNTVITQCANNIISHALEDIDKKRLQEVVGDHFVELLGSLPQGEAIVKGTALKSKFPIWVKVEPELRPASAKTPPMERFQIMNEQQLTQEIFASKRS